MNPRSHPEGGALYNAGWTALTGIDFIGNSCEGTNGINGIVLSGGVASGWPGGDGEGGIGGAVYNAGLLMMTNCEFGSNTVTGGSGGQGGYCTQCTPTRERAERRARQRPGRGAGKLWDGDGCQQYLSGEFSHRAWLRY